MVAFATFGAGETARDAAHHGVVIHLKADGGGDLLARSGQKRVQRGSLAVGAREAVQDDALGHIGLRHAVLQDGKDDVVADQLARIHHGLGRAARLGSCGNRRAQEISG